MGAINKPQIIKAVVRGISTMDGGVKNFPVSSMPDEVLSGISDARDMAEMAQDTANTAKSTAETAQSIAESAQNTANTAKSTAESAQSLAESANDTANTAESTAETAKSTAESAQNTANTAKSTAESAQNTANNLKITMSGSPIMERLFLRSRQSGNQDSTSLDLATKDNYTSMELVESSAGGHVLKISRDGGLHDAATAYNPATLKLVNLGGTKGVVIEGLDALIINSSTSGSTKKFKITVDDTGTISATEVTN